MKITTSITSVALGVGLLLAGGALQAQDAEKVKVKLEPYVTGVNAPLAMVQPPGDDRKFVVSDSVITICRRSGSPV